LRKEKRKKSEFLTGYQIFWTSDFLNVRFSEISLKWPDVSWLPTSDGTDDGVSAAERQKRKKVKQKATESMGKWRWYKSASEDDTRQPWPARGGRCSGKEEQEKKEGEGVAKDGRSLVGAETRLKTREEQLEVLKKTVPPRSPNEQKNGVRGGGHMPPLAPKEQMQGVRGGGHLTAHTHKVCGVV
jgi:hypothetical protein